MKLWTFRKDIAIRKEFGNLRLYTIRYGDWTDGKHITYSELHLWYDNDCKYCPCCWEDRSYEGECNDCGCWLARKCHEEPPIIICMLPYWVKNMLLRLRK